MPALALPEAENLAAQALVGAEANGLIGARTGFALRVYHAPSLLRRGLRIHTAGSDTPVQDRARVPSFEGGEG